MQPLTKRLALTELGQEAGTNPFSFESSRNEVDPRLSVSIPKDVKRGHGFVGRLARTGWSELCLPANGVPATSGFQRVFFFLLPPPYVNLPESGTAAIEVLVSRRGYAARFNSALTICRKTSLKREATSRRS